MEEITLDVFMKERQSLGDNRVQTRADERLRPRGIHGFAQGCTLLRYALSKSPASLKALSGWTLSYSSLYSPQNLVYCTLWISVKIRKEFLFLYMLPSPFKGKGEHVCKYFCKYLFSRIKSSSDKWWYATGNKFKSGKSWLLFFLCVFQLWNTSL